MENEQNQKGTQLQIELTPDVAHGVYANLAMVAHGSSEVVFDFIKMLPGMPKASVQSRVVMAPEHAKRLLMALEDNLRRYEQTFGPIRVPEAQAKGRTIAPFPSNKGEA